MDDVSLGIEYHASGLEEIKKIENTLTDLYKTTLKISQTFEKFASASDKTENKISFLDKSIIKAKESYKIFKSAVKNTSTSIDKFTKDAYKNAKAISGTDEATKKFDYSLDDLVKHVSKNSGFIDLNRNVTSLNRTMEIHRKMLPSLQKEIEIYEQKIGKSSAGIDEYSHVVEKVTEQLDNFKDEHSKSIKTYDELSKSISISEKSLKSYSASLGGMKRSLNSSQGKLARYKSELNNVSEKIKKSSAIFDKFIDTNSKTISTYSELQKEVSKVKTRIEYLRKTYEKQLNSVDKTTTKLEKQKNELNKLNIAYSKSVNTTNVYSKESVALRSKISMLEGKISKTITTLNTQNEKYKATYKEIRNLNDVYEKAVQKEEEYRNKNNDVLTTLDKYIKKNKKLSDTKMKIIHSIDDEKNNVKRLNSQYSQMEKTYKVTHSGLSLMKKDYERLTPEINKLKKTQEGLAKDLKTVIYVRDMHTKNLKHEQKALKDLESNYSNLEKQLKDGNKYYNKYISVNKHLIKTFKDVRKVGKVAMIKGTFQAIKQRTNEGKKAFKGYIKSIFTLRNGFKVIGKSSKFAIKNMALSVKGVYKLTKAFAGFGARQFAKGLSLIGQKLIGVKEGFGRLAGGGIKMVSQAMSDLIRGVLSKGVSAFTDFTKVAFESFGNLQQSLAKIKVFGGFDSSEMSGVGEILRSSLKNTLFDAEQLQAAFEELAAVGEFGGNVERFNQFADTMVKMATATGEVDLERVGQILMTTSNAFQQQNKELAEYYIRMGQASDMNEAMGMVISRTGDILTKVANESALTVSQIGTAMQYTNQTAAALGISLEDTASMVGFLSNMGFEASRAGTALNQVMKSIIDPSQQARNMMADLGIEFYDAQGNVLPLLDIIGNLETSLEGLTEQQQLEAISTIFGVRGARAMLAMMNETDQMVDMMQSVGQDSAGAMDEGMEEMTNTIQGRTEQIKGSFIDLQYTMMEALSPILLDNGEEKGLLTVIRDFIQSPAIISFFIDIGEALASFTETLMPLIENFLPIFVDKILPPMMILLETMLSLLTDILTPLMTNVNVWEMIGGVVMMVVEVFNTFYPVLTQLIQLLVSYLAPVFMDIIGILLTGLAPLLQTIINLFAAIMPVAMPVLQHILKAFKMLAPIIMLITQAVFELVGGIIEALLPIFDALAGIVINNIEIFKTMATIVLIVIAIFKALVPVIEFIVGIIVDTFAPVIEGILNDMATFVNFIFDSFEWLIKKLRDVAEALDMDDVVETLDNVSSSISGVREEVADLGEMVNDFDGELPVSVSYDNIDDSFMDFSDNLSTSGVTYDIDYSATDYDLETDLGLDETYDVDVNLNADGVTMEDGITLNAEELDAVLSRNLEPLGSSIMDIIDTEVLRGALGVGGAFSNVTTSSESPQDITNVNNSTSNISTEVENMYILAKEDYLEEVTEPNEQEEFLYKIARDIS